MNNEGRIPYNNPNRGEGRKEKQMNPWTSRLLIGALLLAGSLALSVHGAEPPNDIQSPDLSKLVGHGIEGHGGRVWKYIEVLIEWGFGKGTEALPFDGSVEASQVAPVMVGKAQPLSGDRATTMTGKQAWKSPVASGARRGIVLPVLYASGSVRISILTVRTASGSFSFRPADLEDGPILAPEYGFFVANAASNTTAAQFETELAAKGLKTIRQRVREMPEQSWEGAIEAFFPKGMWAPRFPPVPYESKTKIEVPCPYLTGLWRIGAWQLVKNCPRVKRADLKKLPSIATFAREIREKLQAADAKDPEGIYIVPDNIFIPLAVETDRIILALDHLGMHEVAQDGITVWLELQQPDGALFISSYDDTRHSIGALMILCAIMEHYQLTGNREWLEREKPRLRKAVEWIIERRRKTMKETLTPQEAEELRQGRNWSPYGLQLRMPCGDGEKGEYTYWNDAGGYRSVLMCAEAFRDIDADLGRRLLEEAAAYRKDLWKVVEKSIVESPVMRVKDGTCRSWVPQSFAYRGPATAFVKMLPVNADYGHCSFFSADIVATSASIEFFLKSGLLTIDDPRVDGHFEVLEDLFLSNNDWIRKRTKDFDPEKQWFANAGFGYQSGWERLPDYYLLKDDVPNFLRAWLNRMAVDLTFGSWMFQEHTTRGGCGDKSHGNAVFLTNFRNMLAMELGDTLWLARATPRVWLAQGKKISVKNAPTYFGTLAFEIVSDVANGKISATVEIPARKAPKEVVLRFRHPTSAPIKGVTVNGKDWKDFNKDKETITLKDLTGTVAVTAQY